jgi:ketosteroid isomerase-like protein
VDTLSETKNPVMTSLTRVFIRTAHLILILSCTYTRISAQSQDEEHIVRAIERLRMVMMQPDSAVLASLVSNDLEYVHSSGTVRDKNGFINEFMKRQTNVTKVVFSNQTIRLSGDMAIVRHRMVADAHNPGYPPLIDIIVMMVWKKENGDWKLLARQAAKLPAK